MRCATSCSFGVGKEYKEIEGSCCQRKSETSCWIVKRGGGALLWGQGYNQIESMKQWENNNSKKELNCPCISPYDTWSGSLKMEQKTIIDNKLHWIWWIRNLLISWSDKSWSSICGLRLRPPDIKKARTLTAEISSPWTLKQKSVIFGIKIFSLKDLNLFHVCRPPWASRSNKN